jgi:peptide/histidine transporter 3/4
MQILLVADNLRNFSLLQSHGPKIQDDSLQVPLLKDKKRAGSKAPAVVLGEQAS